MFKKLHLGASITRDGRAVSRHKTDPGPHTSDRERKIGERRSEPQRPTGTPQARHGPAHGRGRREGCWEGPPRPRSHVAVILEASAEQAPRRSPAARPRVLRTGPRPAGVWGLCRPRRHSLRVTWWRPQSLRPVSLRGATGSVLSAGRPAFLRPPAWRRGRPRVRVREALSSQAPSAVFLS